MIKLKGILQKEHYKIVLLHASIFLFSFLKQGTAFLKRPRLYSKSNVILNALLRVVKIVNDAINTYASIMLLICNLEA